VSAQYPVLEPLSTGDIIDRSIGIYRRNARPLLATVTVPFVVGALGWLLVQLAHSFTDESGAPAAGDIAASLVLLLVGFGLTLVYTYLMILAVGGLSRAVGDHIMLGTPITVAACLGAIRSRLGDLTVGSLLLAVGFVVASMIAGTILIVAIFVVVLVAATFEKMALPAAVVGTIFAIVTIAALAAIFLFVVPQMVARIVFIPHAIMIEGCGAGAALTRAMSLGAKNWHRVLGILAFSYFASWSLVAAVLTPLLVGLWLTGYLSFDFETFNAVMGGINQFSSFLVIPVWAIAFTLLYFDSRVRKEGYDVDLLVRRLPPPPRPAPGQAPPPILHPTQAVAPAPKFDSDGKCLRCGRYNLGSSRTCSGCGW
jgi:hypothetical protein